MSEESKALVTYVGYNSDGMIFPMATTFPYGNNDINSIGYPMATLPYGDTHIKIEEVSTDKPKTVAPYIETDDLPDCVIMRKGDKLNNEKMYSKVICKHCQSLLLTRVVHIIDNTTSFWCPVCDKQSSYFNNVKISYDPMIMRTPISDLCSIM